MANNMNPWVIGAVIIAALYFAVPGFQDGVNNIFSPGEDTGDVCLAYDGTTMTVGPLEYKYDPTTSAATESSRVYQVDNGNYIDIGSKNKTQTFETQPGDTFKIIYADSSSVFYANEADITVPCAAAFATATVDGGKYKLVANKTPTITVFNEDDGLLNTAGDNETLGANDASNMDVVVSYPSKGGWSPNGNVVITVKVNSTVMTDVDLASSDVTITNGDTPGFRQAAASASGFKLYTFEHPGIETESVKKVEYSLTVKTGSSAGTDDVVTVYFDDEDWYRDSDTGIPAFGAEDEDDANVGHTAAVSKDIYFG